MATVVHPTRPVMLGMATRVIRLVMTEMLTMVATVGIILLQMRLGTMSGRSSRHKGGCSCNKIRTFSGVRRCKVIALALAMNRGGRFGSIDIVFILIFDLCMEWCT